MMLLKLGLRKLSRKLPMLAIFEHDDDEQTCFNSLNFFSLFLLPATDGGGKRLSTLAERKDTNDDSGDGGA